LGIIVAAAIAGHRIHCKEMQGGCRGQPETSLSQKNSKSNSKSLVIKKNYLQRKNVKGRELRVSCKVPDPIPNTAYDCNRLLSEDIGLQLDEDKSGSIVFERNGDIFLWESVHALLYTSASQPDTGN